MGKSSVADLLMDLIWYMTFLSFLILLFRRILKKKTIFDLLFRKRVKEIQQNIIYHNESDKKESDFPSLFNKLYDHFLSIIILIDETNYYIINHFVEINHFFNQLITNNETNQFTYEFIIVNNNIMSNTDIQYFQKQPKVRIISLNNTMKKGTAIQIGCFSASGKFILYLSLSETIQSLSKFLNFYKIQINYEYCTILPVRRNCPQYTYLQRYLIFRKYIDKVHDIDFDSFILSKKAAQIVLENIHFSSRYSFNLEFLIILKSFGFRIIETPIDVDYSKIKSAFKDRIISIFSVIGLLIARFLDLYSYSFRLPLKLNSNDMPFFSRIDL